MLKCFFIKCLFPKQKKQEILVIAIELTKKKIQNKNISLKKNYTFLGGKLWQEYNT